MLDFQRLLDTTFLANVEHYPILSSTQDRGRELAANSDSLLPTLVMADAQSAGRGRGSNHWWTGSGSLAFSLVFDPQQTAATAEQNIPRISLAAAVAMIDAVQQTTQGLIVGLHWPNDIYAKGRKIAGILIDVVRARRHVLGIGINTNNSFVQAPADVQRRAISLVDLLTQPIDHTELLVAFLKNFEEVLIALAEHPEALGRRFDELCLQHGEVLTLRNGHEVIHGVCEGVAPDGALLLATETGRKRCYSGTLNP